MEAVLEELEEDKTSAAVDNILCGWYYSYHLFKTGGRVSVQWYTVILKPNSFAREWFIFHKPKTNWRKCQPGSINSVIALEDRDHPISRGQIDFFFKKFVWWSIPSAQSTHVQRKWSIFLCGDILVKRAANPIICFTTSILSGHPAIDKIKGMLKGTSYIVVELDYSLNYSR